MRFSERQGLKPPKLELQIDGMDEDLRSSLWSCLILTLLANKDDFSERKIIDFGKSAYVYFFKWPVDRVHYRSQKVIESIKTWYFKCEWYEVYDFVEFALQYSNKLYGQSGSHKYFVELVEDHLEREKSGYRIVAGQFAPLTNSDEINSINSAAMDTRIEGAAEHIRTAIQHFSNRNAPDYRNSIKESISAVESTVRVLSGNNKATLGEALKLLEKHRALHPALKEGLNKLYGYTSDEAGVRHALLEEGTSVDKTDALFMLVICSAFCNYLRGKLG